MHKTFKKTGTISAALATLTALGGTAFAQTAPPPPPAHPGFLHNLFHHNKPTPNSNHAGPSDDGSSHDGTPPDDGRLFPNVGQCHRQQEHACVPPAGRQGRTARPAEPRLLPHRRAGDSRRLPPRRRRRRIHARTYDDARLTHARDAGQHPLRLWDSRDAACRTISGRRLLFCRASQEGRAVNSTHRLSTAPKFR